MPTKYDPRLIEKKWQRVWAKSHPKPGGKKRKYYVLDMFPYPSGDGLHVGHVENFTATDIYARFMRFQGHEVIHPIGWDAFGLPAENFAIKTGIHPDKRTKQSIKNFTRQIKSLGLSYDWEREINTSSPDYYRWTQWMFLFLYKHGLAYKKRAKVNWCPSCQTVLANEQVVEGKCERSGDTVIQKDLEQWFFKITDFIEPTRSKTGKKISGLLSGLEKIDWPASTKLAQKNWIGKSEGAEVIFPVAETEEDIRVFTTRLDTIYGCTYVVVAPEHLLLTKLGAQITNYGEVQKYLERTKKKTDLERTELNKEKTGVCLEGLEAVHPFTGKRLPVYVADYVLATYGTGAVMGVPAHDERDGEFAKKYGLETKSVIEKDIRGKQHLLLHGYTGSPQANFFPWLKKELEKRGANVEAPVLPHTENPTVDEQAEFVRVHCRLSDDTTIVGHSLGVAVGLKMVEKSAHPVQAFYSLAGFLRPNFKDRARPFEKSWPEFDFEKIRSSIRSLRILRDLNDSAVPAEQGRLFKEILGGDIVDFTAEEDHICGKNEPRVLREILGGECFTADGILSDSSEFSGLTSAEAREKMAEWLKKERMGKKTVQYRMRDWLISRQRYWGAPIPIIYCDSCGTVPVPENDLPVKLPTDVDFRPTGESPLVSSKSFHRVKCPKCGKKARRESDTMDTFVCSSWYYLRYADPQNVRAFASRAALKKYLPVDFYMGGAEHTVLHLLYARFFTKALMKYGHLNFDEPFLKLRHQGIILGEDGNKMSKSKGNVINPDTISAEFGADALRLYEMFMGPLDEMKAWNTASIVGLKRFLERVWRLERKAKNEESGISDSDIEGVMHRTIRKVTDDIENFKFNTAISCLMICLNELEKCDSVPPIHYSQFLILLSPFAPHVAEELWYALGRKQSIFLASWPKWDPKKIKDETREIVVQVNGKIRERLRLAADTSERECREQALASPQIQKFLAGQEPKKIIFVPGRLMNIVV